MAGRPSPTVGRMTTRNPPRRRLPARVYWFRRGLVLVTALALVFGVAQLFGSDGEDPPAVRAKVAANDRPTAAPRTPRMIGPVPVRTRQPKKGTGKPAGNGQSRPVAQPLAQPDGPCNVEEVSVVPKLTSARAGDDIVIPLELTGTRAACTFTVSAKTVVVKVTNAKGRVWSTQDCRKAIRTQEVVVRSAAPTRAVAVWAGRHSDENCSRQTKWAMPGSYVAVAAAIGSEPTEQKLRLTTPPRAIVTKTVEPEPEAD